MKSSSKLLLVVVATCAYFLTAYYLKTSYVPDNREKVVLVRPYSRVSDFAVAVERKDAFAEDGDNNEEASRSPIEIYEDGKQLGPPHSNEGDITLLGKGRFSHRRSAGGATVIWSSSDNSDPMTNGRTYFLVNPVKAKGK